MAQKDRKDKAEPWRGIMVDVAEMMEEAIETADQIVGRYVDKGRPTEERTRQMPSTDSVIRMGVAIFDATVTAEGGRRMMEAQKEIAASGQLLKGGIIAMGPDGRPITG